MSFLDWLFFEIIVSRRLTNAYYLIMLIITLIAIFLAIFFSFGHFAVVGVMIVIPFIGLGLLFFFGKLPPKSLKRAKFSIILIPLVVSIIAGIPGAWRVSQRIDDGNYGTRIVEGNGKKSKRSWWIFYW